MQKQWLIERFTQDLPGELAHAPYKRYRQQFEKEYAAQERRAAAVALHFYLKDEAWHFILIERSTYNGQHSGQMAFPGGKPEATDPHLEFTARRESFEEIGIPLHHGQHIKTLSNVWIPVSGFEVSPLSSCMSKHPTPTRPPRGAIH